MKFFVHKVPKLYSDLLKYDLRARLGQFTIASPTTSIEYADVIDGLYCHGYIRDAEVYYLDPTPGSMPCTGLVKIIEAEDVKLMVSAHAQMGTKIAHLYLVSTYEDQSPHVSICSSCQISIKHIQLTNHQSMMLSHLMDL